MCQVPPPGCGRGLPEGVGRTLWTCDPSHDVPLTGESAPPGGGSPEGLFSGGLRAEGFCRPLQAFMELGSAQQAQDLVQFHQKEPLTVQDEQMEFTVSHTFSFPQVGAVRPAGLLRVWSGWPKFLWCFRRAPGW